MGVGVYTSGRELGIFNHRLHVIKTINPIKKQNKKLSFMTVAGSPLPLLTITAQCKLIVLILPGEQKMTNISDSDKNGASDAAATEVIEIKIDPKNPKGKTTVTGEYSLHGYKGAIEIEYTWSNNIYTISALRYLFERGAITGKNPRFEISAQEINGPILAVIPPQNGQWHHWGSSTNYPTASTVMYFTIYFIFNAPPGGVWQTDSKSVRLLVA